MASSSQAYSIRSFCTAKEAYVCAEITLGNDTINDRLVNVSVRFSENVSRSAKLLVKAGDKATARPAVSSCWNWKGQEGKQVKVVAYSAAQEIELRLNGKVLERKTAGKENRYMAEFSIEYEPESLVLKIKAEGLPEASLEIRVE